MLPWLCAVPGRSACCGAMRIGPVSGVESHVAVQQVVMPPEARILECRATAGRYIDSMALFPTHIRDIIQRRVQKRRRRDIRAVTSVPNVIGPRNRLMPLRWQPLQVLIGGTVVAASGSVGPQRAAKYRVQHAVGDVSLTVWSHHGRHGLECV